MSPNFLSLISNVTDVTRTPFVNYGVHVLTPIRKESRKTEGNGRKRKGRGDMG
jgi:hypothetical protein